MSDLFEFIGELSYYGIFALMIGINAAPLFMPPTWIVLSSFYALDSSLDPLVLAAVGATGATLGRMALKHMSGYFRRFTGTEHRTNLDVIGRYLNGKRYGYVLASFLFAATPLPSSMLFVAYGLMGARNIGMYLGFWFGRLLSYYVMISISSIVLTPFLQIFEDRLVGILVADAIGIGAVIFFASINWGLLITRKKLGFVRPTLWRT